MKQLAPMILSLSLCACIPEQPLAQPPTNSVGQQGATAMEVSRSATSQPGRGPADWFTGTATITPLFDPKGLSQVGAALVRFRTRRSYCMA